MNATIGKFYCQLNWSNYRGFKCFIRSSLWSYANVKFIKDRFEIVSFKLRFLTQKIVISLFKTIRFVLSRIFSTSNITEPIKFLMRLILGTDFSKKSPELAAKLSNIDNLEKLWSQSSGTVGSSSTSSLISVPKKIFGMSARLFFSIVALASSILI